MFFAAFLIAAVCARDFTIEFQKNEETDLQKEGREILSDADKLELLLLRNFDKVTSSKFIEPLINNESVGDNKLQEPEVQEQKVKNNKVENNKVENNKVENNKVEKQAWKDAKGRYGDIIFTLKKDLQVENDEVVENVGIENMAKALHEVLAKGKFEWPSENDKTASAEDLKKSFKATFEPNEKLQSPAGDYNLRIVKDADLCEKQAQHFPKTFAASFKKDKWARFNALDEKLLTPFKKKAGFLPFFPEFSENIKYDIKWDDQTTEDVHESNVELLTKLAVAGCQFKTIRELFKENASDFKGHVGSVPGNSVASFGLSAILALAVFGL